MHTVNPLDTDDPRFGGFRHSLDAEMQRLHAKGLGTRNTQPKYDEDDDFVLLKKKPKIQGEMRECGMFGPGSSLNHCTFNITIQK